MVSDWGFRSGSEVSVTIRESAPPELFAPAVTMNLPASVGMPEINPLLSSNDIPAGNAPRSEKRSGEFSAVI